MNDTDIMPIPIPENAEVCYVHVLYNSKYILLIYFTLIWLWAKNVALNNFKFAILAHPLGGSAVDPRRALMVGGWKI